MNTFFTLMSEFNTGEIPITEIGKKYYGYEESTSKSMAAKGRFPFPVFRLSGQKSTWVVDINQLANYLDKMKEKARKEFNDAR